MKKVVVLYGCCIMLLTACKHDKEQMLTQSEIEAKTDSLVGIKMQDLTQQSMADLEARIAIEVKAKADSIVAARTGKSDTTRKHPAATRISKQVPVIPKKH